MHLLRLHCLMNVKEFNDQNGLKASKRTDTHPGRLTMRRGPAKSNAKHMQDLSNVSQQTSLRTYHLSLIVNSGQAKTVHSHFGSAPLLCKQWMSTLRIRSMRRIFDVWLGPQACSCNRYVCM